MPRITEILLIVTVAGIALWVTRRRPFWGVLLAIGFAALIAMGVALFTPSSSHSSHIHIIEHTSGRGLDWEVMTEDTSALVASATELAQVASDQDVVVTVQSESTACPEGCDDPQPSEHVLVNHEEDEVLAEIADESDFVEDSAWLADNNARDGNSEQAELESRGPADGGEQGDPEALAGSLRAGLRVEKPAWVYQLTPDLGDTKHLVVQSGPYETLEECSSRLVGAMKDAVREYIDEYFENSGRSVPNWFRLEIPSDELYDAITQEFVGLYDLEVAGAEPMPVKYVELELDEGFHKRVIDRYYNQSIQMTRIAQSGVGSIGVLGLIATALGLLKMENWTIANRRGLVAVGIATSLAMLLGFALVVALIR